MRAAKNGSHRHPDTPIGIARCAFAVLAIGVASTMAFAEPQPGREAAATRDGGALRAAALERAFWICDYVATTRGLQFVPVDRCSAVTEQVKIEKFGGDYDGMVQWWQQNKPAEHLKLQGEIKL